MDPITLIIGMTVGVPAGILVGVAAAGLTGITVSKIVSTVKARFKPTADAIGKAAKPAEAKLAPVHAVLATALSDLAALEASPTAGPQAIAAAQKAVQVAAAQVVAK